MESPSERIRLRIEGMHCDGCVRRVRKLLEMAGVREVHGVEIGSAEFSASPDGPSAGMIVKALEDAGYQATVRP